jgi:Type III restriction enzyme, res subunit/Helicase C-terminal domain
MAFKKQVVTSPVSQTPDQLFLDLPRRKYIGLLDHQGQILRTYYQDAITSPDIALQLPTGSGKTLVGLLIAEWRRRKFNERVVYLCPTKQLVNQVVEEAISKYGMEVDGFTGPSKGYAASANARYAAAERVAVTTYSAVFNSNPFFKSPDVILLDDAHAAENYVAKMWAIQIDRTKREHVALFNTLASVIKTVIDPYYHERLTGKVGSISEQDWTDKIPTTDFYKIVDEVRSVLDAYSGDSDIEFPWKSIKDNLMACHVYVSSHQILIRPVIPPTWIHSPFSNAKQRIFMSATLGEGGDLERLTGRRYIKRLTIPSGWDRQGIGRRFFVFPGLSLDEDKLSVLRNDLMKEAGRSLVLVTSELKEKETRELIHSTLSIPTFSATDIETTKANFLAEPNAAAVIANRYDGIDFPGDDCRILFIDGLPQVVNLQEKFIMTRMAAVALLNVRIQARVLQAIGRCTRGLNDFSAIVVSDGELSDYLIDFRRRQHFHPELQAEIQFGLTQSTDIKPEDIKENFRAFILHDTEWEEANKNILQLRDISTQIPYAELDELQSSVNNEVRYQEFMWQGDYLQALDQAREVIGKITSSELQGYRALWYYLAGSAAHLSEHSLGHGDHGAHAREYFSKARDAARGINWLVRLSRTISTSTFSDAEVKHADALRQVESIENVFSNLGMAHNRAFNKSDLDVRNGLLCPDAFEQAQKLLGDMLGFSTGKVEEDASPDPWWMLGKRVIVFEDHAAASAINPQIDAKKARQAASHEAWIRANFTDPENLEIVSVLVTPATRAAKGAAPSLSSVAYWNLDDFISWANKAMDTLREIRSSYPGTANIEWRIKAAEALEQCGADMPGLFYKLKSSSASIMMDIAEK